MGQLAALPQPALGAVVGAVALGAAGCLVGLVVGLHVYPPTAWAATLEIGVPSGIVGAVAGLLAGWLIAHRLASAPPRPPHTED